MIKVDRERSACLDVWIEERKRKRERKTSPGGKLQLPGSFGRKCSRERDERAVVNKVFALVPFSYPSIDAF